MASGAVVKTAFCGPCFGAGDTPCNNAFSIRHTTRNFPSREGSKPTSCQMSAVALMDARSIAATAVMGGELTSATDLTDRCGDFTVPDYTFNGGIYEKRVYQGYGKADLNADIIYGPNIKDWPEIHPMENNILLKVASKIMDDVTTTDELIPSGETSSYRSNPLGLAEFTLSRRDPEYVQRSKDISQLENLRRNGKTYENPELQTVMDKIFTKFSDTTAENISIGSMVYAVKPGDGSAREQAASCQRVLGGTANIAQEYATKRYRSNLINWGMIPFVMDNTPTFNLHDYIFVPNIKTILDGDTSKIPAYIIGDAITEITLSVAPMTADETEILKAGCLMNFSKNNLK